LAVKNIGLLEVEKSRTSLEIRLAGELEKWGKSWIRKGFVSWLPSGEGR
jgi:hypothetical protein